MANLGLSLVIDVSGQPYDRVIPVLLSFKTADINKITKEFRKEFPGITRCKGTELDANKLDKIVAFLDFHKVWMSAVVFEPSDWKYYREKYCGHGYVKERIYAILYFKLLQKVCRPRYKYGVLLCTENYLDLGRVLDTCRRLQKANKYNFDFSTGTYKYNESLRFADYVASATRKIGGKNLSKYENYSLVSNELPEEYLRKAFRLD